MPFNFTLDGNESYQVYGAERAFGITDNLEFVMNYDYETTEHYEDNSIQFSIRGTW